MRWEVQDSLFPSTRDESSLPLFLCAIFNKQMELGACDLLTLIAFIYIVFHAARMEGGPEL